MLLSTESLQTVDDYLTRPGATDKEQQMPEIEYIVNADHAEAINGKLYLHGAGWTDLQQVTGPAGQPGIVHLGIAVSILINWNETNRRFPLKVTLTHEDGAEIARVDAQVEAGRPPGIPAGSDFRSVLAIGADIQFPKTGAYQLSAELNGQKKTVTFRVNRPVQATGPATLPPAAA
jgi:hypothetical protein